MRVEKRIVAASVALSETAALDADAIGFLPAILCSVGLPRRRVDELTFVRTNGKASLMLTAGQLWNGREWCQQPVPYGPVPRSMLAVICTQAVQRRTREIWIGSSAAEFLRMIGKSPSGGHAADPKTGRPARGAYAALHVQANALAACSITLGFEGKQGPVTESSRLITRFEAWRRSPDHQLALWSPYLQLSAEFADSLSRHSVPFDLRAMTALNRSALAMDVYVWLAYRLYRLAKPVFLPWKLLRTQFGQEYRQLRDFKSEMKTALRRALAVYAQANVSHVTGGVVLKPSPPPVAQVAVNKPVSRESYPRDIAPHAYATLPPTPEPFARDITPHLIPLAVSINKTASRVTAVVDKQQSILARSAENRSECNSNSVSRNMPGSDLRNGAGRVVASAD